jgi:hypothetical protein
MRKFSFLCALALICSGTADAQQRPSDASSPPPWQCGSDAKENWNLSCKITRNTIRANSSESDSWADPFRNVQTITVCAAFDNRGGLHEDTATVLYTGKDGDRSTPLTFFDTIKLGSNMVRGRFSWVGTGSRRSIFPSRDWTMRGELSIPDHGSSVYKEVLANGQKTIGEIDASCSLLEKIESHRWVNGLHRTPFGIASLACEADWGDKSALPEPSPIDEHRRFLPSQTDSDYASGN